MTRTNATTKAIIDFLNFQGHCAHRNNTQGTFDPHHKVWRRLAKTSKGIGDILCCLKGGKWLEIEVKTGKDRMSRSQVQRQIRIQGVGGQYWLVHSFDEFVDIYHIIVEGEADKDDVRFLLKASEARSKKII